MDLSHWLERWADFQPDKVAIRFEGRDTTYGDFHAHVRRTAGALGDGLGVGRGDRVAFLGFNSADFLAIFFACSRLGAMMVPLNWRFAPPENLYILKDCGASALFVEPEFYEGAESMRDGLDGCRYVAMGEAPDGWEEWDALLAGSVGAESIPGAGPDDPVLIVYTSGTTGRPKGAVLTQNAITFNSINSIAAYDTTSQDVVLTNLPMFHVGGLNVHTTPALMAGATVVLQRRFEPDATVAALGDERPTMIVLVPAMMQAILDHPDWEAIDFSCLRLMTTGSTTVPRPLLQAFLDRGIPVVQLYGLTESAPIAILQRVEAAWMTAGAAGKPALYCDARIIDGDGNALPPHEKGEILVRGPNVMREYWNDLQATAEALKDGWLHTGDVGHMDDDGNFHIDDRIKDVIVSGSENIYPAEVEIPLDECPDIAEAAVVARPDARWGEVAVACVVPRPGVEMTRDDILALFEGRIARFKHPSDVVFMDALPRNAMGKTLKHELREKVKR